MDENEVKKIVIEKIRSYAAGNGVKIKKIDEEKSLIKQGIVDSVGLIDVLSILEQEFNITINFAENDPEQFSSVNGLARLIRSAS
ncbi:MAG: acyl carrier protein [Chitinivibrionales bacterium]|nr:acyl carrier protein [Chitinivibrionales bacterium]